jgi:hypothetical protein
VRGGGFRVARPDGFRLDAVKHLPLEFWARFNAEFDAPGFIRLGELLDGDASTVARTWKEGRFTSMFDFPLGFAIADVFCRGESPAKLAAVLTSDRRYPDASALVTLVDNHDLPRIMSLCGGDLEKVKGALAFLFAMRGVPSMTWGTEVGLDGQQEPDNRKSMRFVEHPLRGHVTEWMRRRAASAALRDGVAMPESIDGQRASFVRATDSGDAVRVVVEAGAVRLEPAPAVSPERVAAWRTGGDLVDVRLEGQGAVVGSGPELGDWQLARARLLPVTLALPRFGVFEFKLVRGGRFEDGPNRVLLVKEPARLTLTARD